MAKRPVIAPKIQPADDKVLERLCEYLGIEAAEAAKKDLAASLEACGYTALWQAGRGERAIECWDFYSEVRKGAECVLKMYGHGTYEDFAVACGEISWLCVDDLEDPLRKLVECIDEYLRKLGPKEELREGVSVYALVSLLIRAYERLSGRQFTEEWFYDSTGTLWPKSNGCWFLATAATAVAPGMRIQDVKAALAQGPRSVLKHRRSKKGK